MEQRISKLEARLRRTQLALYSIIGALILTILLGFTNGNQAMEVVRANKFELIDPTSGFVIAQLRPSKATNHERCGVLESFNIGGKHVWYAGSTINQGGGRFDIYDQNGNILQIYDGEHPITSIEYRLKTTKVMLLLANLDVQTTLLIFDVESWSIQTS